MQGPVLCPWLSLGYTPWSLQGRDWGPGTPGAATAFPVETRVSPFLVRIPSVF